MLYLMVGNVGSGKTTVAKALHTVEEFSMYISDDEICTMLNGEYSPKYWTSKHKVLYSKMLQGMVKNILEAGYSAILDSGLHCISKRAREPFIKIANDLGVNVIAYDISHPNALNRRLAQDRSANKTAWRKVFEMFEREYNQPTLDEGIVKVITVTRKEEK